MELRPLTLADLGGLEALIVASEAEGFRFMRRIPGLVAADPGYLESARTVVLGVFDGARLVAVGGLTPDPYLDDPTVGRVRHVYVAVDHRRAGIGRRIIEALERRAASSYTTLRLRTESAQAAAFYESLAYRPVTATDATHVRSVSG
jgi:GNAT superfamily N-acetyltransferase